MLKTLRRRVDAVSLPSRPLHGCASTMMAVFCPQHVSRSPSDQYCCQKCCVWCWTSLYLSLARFPTWGRGPCISHICVCFSLSLLLCVSFSLDFFFPFHFFTHPIVASLSLFLTTYALTESIGWYLFSPPVSYFHYKTEWIWATAWITSPHLAFIHFPEGSQGFSFFLYAAVGTAVNVLTDWLYGGFRVRTVSGWPPFRTTHSLPLFLLSQVIHA